MVAAGKCAEKALNKIILLEKPTGLQPNEIEALKDSSQKPLRDCLRMIVGWLEKDASLEKEASKEKIPTSPHQPMPDLPPGTEVYINPQRHGNRTKESESADGGSQEPEAKLTDDTLPESDRLDAAVALGPAAVATLADLLRDPKQREFATIALQHLGQTH